MNLEMCVDWDPMTFPSFLCNDRHIMQTPSLYFFMFWLRFNYLTTSVFISPLLASENNKCAR